MDENLRNLSEHSNFLVWEMLRTWYKADLQTIEMGKHGQGAAKNDTDILAESDGCIADHFQSEVGVETL